MVYITAILQLYFTYCGILLKSANEKLFESFRLLTLLTPNNLGRQALRKLGNTVQPLPLNFKVENEGQRNAVICQRS